MKFKFDLELNNEVEIKLSEKLKQLQDMDEIKQVKNIQNNSIDVELKMSTNLYDFLVKLEMFDWVANVKSFTKQN